MDERELTLIQLRREYDFHLAKFNGLKPDDPARLEVKNSLVWFQSRVEEIVECQPVEAKTLEVPRVAPVYGPERDSTFHHTPRMMIPYGPPSYFGIEDDFEKINSLSEDPEISSETEILEDLPPPVLYPKRLVLVFGSNSRALFQLLQKNNVGSVKQSLKQSDKDFTEIDLDNIRLVFIPGKIDAQQWNKNDAANADSTRIKRKAIRLFGEANGFVFIGEDREEVEGMLDTVMKDYDELFESAGTDSIRVLVLFKNSKSKEEEIEHSSALKGKVQNGREVNVVAVNTETNSEELYNAMHWLLGSWIGPYTSAPLQQLK